MKAKVYLKLALRNIFSNGLLFRPYIAMSTIMIALFFLLQTLVTQIYAANSSSLNNLAIILNVGIIVCCITCLLVVQFINSFLIKQRTNELGLYSVIGVEKKSLIALIALETVLVFCISLLLGLVLGLLFAKLVYLIMIQIIRISTGIPFLISMESILYTIGTFLLIFIATVILTSVKMSRLNPIDIIREKEKGERAPKFRLLHTVSGIALLGIGYSIAISVKNPLQAFQQFFIASFLIIIGTQFLFSSVSIAVLKYLQSKRNIYYKNSNMISISTMLFRMKKNARGLTSICILSTMLLVSFSTTLALNMNIDALIRNRFAYDVEYTYKARSIDAEANTAIVNAEAAKHNVVAKDFNTTTALTMFSLLEDNTYAIQRNYSFGENSRYIQIMELGEINRHFGAHLELAANTAYIVSKTPMDSIALQGNEQTLQYALIPLGTEYTKDMPSYDYMIVETITLVVNSFDELANITDIADIKTLYRFNLEGKQEDKMDFLHTVSLDAAREDSITSKDDMFGMYGSLFFIGLYVSIIFLIASLLVIYYKQITEGIEDRERFRTLLNIGVEKKEVKKMIKQQIIYIFFLPLLLAIVHLGFATPILSRLLVLLNFRDMSLLLGSCAIVAAVYFILYILMYKITSRAYYKVIQ